MGLGFVIACGSVLVAVVVLIYLGVTLTAAILTEESVLRERFGDEYDRYADGLTSNSDRRFSVDRAIDNREYRAIFGLVMVVGLLAFRIWIG
jgi:phage-related protein